MGFLEFVDFDLLLIDFVILHNSYITVVYDLENPVWSLNIWQASSHN